jgi:hypothetical protein
VRDGTHYVPAIICILGLAVIDGLFLAKEKGKPVKDDKKPVKENIEVKGDADVDNILWIICLLSLVIIGCWFLAKDAAGKDVTRYVPVIICILGLAIVGGACLINDKLKYMLVVTCVLSTAIIGCGSFLDKLTPADVPKPALAYLEKDPNKEPGKDPNTVGFSSLYKAREIKNDIIIKHHDVQSDLLYKAEQDKYAYQNARDMIDASIKEAENLQDIVIGNEKQPFSILGLLAGATGGGFIGYRIKRKEDYTEDEVKTEVASNDTEAQAKGWDECIDAIRKGVIKVVPLEDKTSANT